MGAGVSHAALGLHEYNSDQQSSRGVIPLATDAIVIAEPVQRGDGCPELWRLPEHLITASLVAYLSPSEIDAFLLSCHEYYVLSEMVWRMRWEADELEASREAGGFLLGENSPPGNTTVSSGTTHISADGNGNRDGAAQHTQSGGARNSVGSRAEVTGNDPDMDADVAAAIAASLRDTANGNGGGALSHSQLTSAVPDPDFVEHSGVDAQTKTHRRRVFDAWLRRGKTFVGTKNTNLINIMHGDNLSYWNRHEPCRDSLSGFVASCRQVCWFDLQASHHVKGPGQYVVSFRVKYTSKVSEAFNLKLTASGHTPCAGEGVTGEGSALILPHYDGQLAEENWLPDSPSSFWRRLMVGTIDVDDPLGAKITARIWKHSASWVGNLNFDYLHVQSIQEYKSEQEGRKGRRRRRSAKQSEES